MIASWLAELIQLQFQQGARCEVGPVAGAPPVAGLAQQTQTGQAAVQQLALQLVE